MRVILLLNKNYRLCPLHREFQCQNLNTLFLRIRETRMMQENSPHEPASLYPLIICNQNLLCISIERKPSNQTSKAPPLGLQRYLICGKEGLHRGRRNVENDRGRQECWLAKIWIVRCRTLMSTVSTFLGGYAS